MASPLSLATPVRYQQQPQASVQVDWSHPLARGLVFFQIPNQQAARDLVGGSAPTILGATTVSGGPGGRGLLASTTTTTGWSTPYRSDRLRTMTTEFTVACHVDIQAITAFSKLVCLPLFQTSWTAPYQSFSLGRNSSTSQVAITM